MREIPASTILLIDLEKVKLNLKVESIVYNFLILLFALDIFLTVLLYIGTVSSVICYPGDSWTNNYTSNRTKPEYQDRFGFGICMFNLFTNMDFSYTLPLKLTQIADTLQRIAITMSVELGCLFLLVLRRLYLNLPYKHWIKFYKVWIAIKLFPIISLPFDPFVNLAIYPLEFIIGIIDFVVYIHCCRTFSRLLKGRTMEAKWHSTASDYKIKRRISKQFYYAHKWTIFLFSLIIILYALRVCGESLLLLLYYADNLNTLSFKLFHRIVLPSKVRSIIQSIFYYNFAVLTTEAAILAVVVFAGYLLVCIGIVLKLIKRRRSYKHVNGWITKPLMERYRATLESPNRNYLQRPAFIQAFRSGLIY